MSVRICGHKVRWQKPIKFYSYFNRTAVVLVAMLLLAPSVYASEPQLNKNSSGPAPCTVTKSAPTANNAPLSHKEAQNRIQRSAGPSMTPAMALALALGVRNISGPLEQSVKHTPQRQNHAGLLSGDGRCVLSKASSPSRLAMDRY